MKERIMRPGLLSLAMVCLVAAVHSAGANTVAYWRFEEGSSGSPVPASTAGGDPAFNNTVLDSSGTGNHLRTWADFTAPTYVGDTPFAAVPQTGSPNTLALSFSPNQDLYTDGSPINSHQFEAWTLEVSFKPNVVEAWQVIVGKDGQSLLPGSETELHGAPPIFFKTMGGGADIGKLELGLVDGGRDFRGVLSSEPLQIGEWYSAAATGTATEMSFWLKGPGDADYVLQGTVGINGAFVSPDDFLNPADFDRSWTVGRGMWAGGIADWFNGTIDEIRISDSALSPSQFLAVPEPGTYALLALGGTIFLFFRRRWR